MDLSAEAVRARIMLEIQVIIAYPREADAQRQFLCVLAATLAEGRMAVAGTEDPTVAAGAVRAWEIWEALYQESGGRRTLLDSPSLDEVLKDHHKRFLKGLIAGWVLLLVLIKARAAPGKASLNAAKEAVRRELPDEVAKFLRMPASHRPVDEAWSQHRHVSHLAAGLLNIRPVMLEPRVIVPQGSLVGMTGTPLALSVYASEPELRSILKGAFAAGREAGSIIPHGQSEPILPACKAKPLPRWAAPHDDEIVEWAPAVVDAAAALIRQGVQGICSAGLRCA